MSRARLLLVNLGVPAIVGCGNATEVLVDGQEVTVSCAEGDTGFIYEGLLDFEVQTNSVESYARACLQSYDERG